jgi:hypothetical protein
MASSLPSVPAHGCVVVQAHNALIDIDVEPENAEQVQLYQSINLQSVGTSLCFASLSCYIL